MSAPAEIAVIVVNYGTADLAMTAVRSVLSRDHGGRTVTVHLVDNASPAGTDAAAFQEAFGSEDQVTLYLEQENHGFGRGNNVVLDALAAQDSPPDFVFLLNPDAQLDGEALDQMASFLERTPAAAAAGAGIALPSGADVTAAFRFPSAAAEFSHALNFGPVSRMMQSAQVALPPDHPEGPVDWVAGAAVMFRFDVVRALGGFDPAFFLYFEEVDLMRQIRKAGHEIWYLPSARVIHAEGAATNVRSGVAERRSKPEYWYDSWRIYYLKNHGRAGALWAATCWMVGAALNRVLALLRRQSPKMPLHFFRDITRFVLRPLLRAGKPS